jgi:Carboxypeptidase regulatory-like domain/TonB dependent receptor
MNKLQMAIGAAAIFASIISGSTLVAQTTTGQITGTVEDSTGAAIPDAVITAVMTDTHATRETLSGSHGEYVLTLLPIGSYQVTVSKPGFQSQTTNLIQLEVNQNITINPKLAVGTTTITVDVVGQGALLDSTSSTLGTVIGEQSVKDLPLNGRNFTQLLTLVPGATPISTSQGARIGTDDGGAVAIPGSSFSNPAINGQQNRETLYLLDGVVNTDFRTTTYTVLPIIDGISEFKVQSHNDDPGFGSVLGGVVNLISKSGTNSFHGSAWEFIRNNAFNARNPFTDINSDGSAKKVGAFHQNEFGGTIGGPIRIPRLYNGVDKTFFFFGYEGWRFSNPVASLYNVPSDAEISGNFTVSHSNTQIYDPTTTTFNTATQTYSRQAFANSTIPSSRISAQMQGYIQAYYDRPNLTGNPNFNEVLNAPSTNNDNNYQGRIDQVLTHKDTVFFRWSNMFSFLNQPSTNKLSNTTDFGGLNIGTGITHVFSPKMVLNINGGRASRAFTFVNLSKVGLAPLTTLGFQGIDQYGPVAVNLTAYGGSGLNSTALRRNSSWSVGGVLNWQVGRHSLNFGTTVIEQYRSQHGTGQNLNFDTAQTADPLHLSTTGNAVASALLGYPTSGNFQGQNTIRYSIPSYAIYAGDSWKVSSKLTLNYGLRYDRLNQPGFTAGMNNGFNFDTGNWEIGGGVLPPSCLTQPVAPCIPGTSTSATANLAAIVGRDGSIAGNHIIVSPVSSRAPASLNLQFGPRVGFAYMLDSSTVVHAGFGIVFDTLNGISQLLSNTVGEWPAKGSVSQTYNVLGTPLVNVAAAQAAVGTPLTTGGPFNDSNYYYSPKFRPPYSEQYNLLVEHSFSKKTLLSAGYVGSVSRHIDYNSGGANSAVTPGPGTAAQVNARRPFPYMTNFHYDSATGTGNYNSLQAKLEQKLTNGLQALVSYTWSKSLDTGSGLFNAEEAPGTSVENYYDPASNYGPSGYDVPHFLSISALYELPFGKGKPFMNSGPLAYVLGNWQVNTLSQFRSGQNYSLAINGDIANVGTGGNERPNLVGNPFLSHPTYKAAFNTAAFAAPASYTFGNIRKGTMRAQSFKNADMSLFKNFPFAEHGNVEFRAEAFNIFNIINPGIPQSNMSSTSFGVVSSISGLPRQLQFALKISY